MDDEHRPATSELPDRAESGTVAVLHAMLTTFSEVLGGLDQRLAGLEAAVAERQPAEAPPPVVVQLDPDGEVVAAIAAAAATSATTAIAADLGHHVEQAVGQGLEGLGSGVRDPIVEAMQCLAAALEGRQARLDEVVDILRSVVATVEGVGVRVEESRERVADAVAGMQQRLRQTEGFLQQVFGQVQGFAEVRVQMSGLCRDVAALGSRLDAGEAVAQESEALGARVGELSEVVQSLRALLETRAGDVAASRQGVEDPAAVRGRRPTEGGRRLGLRAKDVRSADRRALGGTGTAAGTAGGWAP